MDKGTVKKFIETYAAEISSVFGSYGWAGYVSVNTLEKKVTEGVSQKMNLSEEDVRYVMSHALHWVLPNIFRYDRQKEELYPIGSYESQGDAKSWRPSQEEFVSIMGENYFTYIAARLGNISSGKS